MDESAADATGPRPEGQNAKAKAAEGEGAPKKTAAEYAETFNKAVDVAEQVLRFAPLHAGAKRVELATPVFQRLTETQIARETSVAMTFGGVEDE